MLYICVSCFCKIDTLQEQRLPQHKLSQACQQQYINILGCRSVVHSSPLFLLCSYYQNKEKKGHCALFRHQKQNDEGDSETGTGDPDVERAEERKWRAPQRKSQRPVFKVKAQSRKGEIDEDPQSEAESDICTEYETQMIHVHQQAPFMTFVMLKNYLPACKTVKLQLSMLCSSM